MSSNKASYLQVYKASAGSGKTHQLTGEYIRLLFSKPNNYKHILAVTFTNKATDEMKSRIIEELNNLATGNDSPYLEQLKKETGSSEDVVRNHSRAILHSILHNYSDFSVSTIDSFFQRTMRAFTREMGIAGGYKVEVDNQSFLPEIVDLMLNELEQESNDSDLIKWLLDFMKERIEENKTWKINDEIVKLASNLFNEDFITLSASEQEQINNRDTLNEYKKELQRIIRRYENEIKRIGKQALSIVDKYDLSFSDFKGGERSQFFKFEKWAAGEIPDMTATFKSFLDDITSWYTKTTSSAIKSSIESAYHDGLNDCVKEIIALYDDCINYVTSKEILRLFNTLGILSDVNNRMQAYRREANMLFLSDTKELLNKIIADSDSPFVYEKIGLRLNHFMIDEFQDTSTMQWNNFRPLLHESLASGNYNLIVGDVKQSIYRWRNSDWRLLEEKIEKDFSKFRIQQKALDINWRSDGKIVTFNNAFFKNAATALQNEYNGIDSKKSEYFSTKINAAYSQVAQEIAPIRDADAGMVSLNFIEQQKDVKWEREALDLLPKTLEALQDDGFQPKDIAILVRTSKEAVAVSECLLEYKYNHPNSKYNYDFISNQALLLNNSSCVKAAVALLQYINSPHEKTTRVRAIYEYYCFTTKKSASDIFNTYVKKHTEAFPEELTKLLAPIISLPLYELIEALFNLLKEATEPTDVVYIQAFLDIVNEYTIRKTADLNGFLEWWSDVKEEKSLFSPDNQNAMQLMTIHKSKGLQFGAVVLPFADWQFEPRSGRDILWCKPQEAPFNNLGVVPVHYSNKLASTIFEQEYLEEKLFSYIDNLNLLYVAFTRPKHRLIVIAPKPTKKVDAIKKVSDLLWQSVKLPLFEEFADEGSKEQLSYNWGEAQKLDKQESIAVKDEIIPTKWQSTPFRNRLKMRLSSIGYFSDDGSRDFGTLMHEIVSEINTLDDLESALEKRVLSGELTAGDKSTLRQELSKSLSLPEVRDWYSGDYYVLNEQQVLHPSNKFIRPDRVMIKDGRVIVVDYKFGSLVENKYVKQVQGYMSSIRGMGYADVQGYLFYVTLGKVVKV